ncbi:MAG: hypothetical protein IPK08_19880 [Bacteroidetes bacterium]|nr:hypothetical protein [Bacteroidota bacterium]
MQKNWTTRGNKIKTVEGFYQPGSHKILYNKQLYYILFPNGTKMESAKWLRQTLKDIE